jgi:DNA polymerase V
MLTAFETTTARPLNPARIDPTRRRLPLGGVRATLGFPSPAEDYADDTIDLNELLIRNEPATFFYKAQGESMLLAGIRDGDILAVDRSVTPQDGDLVLAIWEGNTPVCKLLKVCGEHVELHSAHPRHPPIVFEPAAEVEVFAIVAVARQVVRGRVRTR